MSDEHQADKSQNPRTLPSDSGQGHDDGHPHNHPGFVEVVVVYLTQTLEPEDDDYPESMTVKAVIERAYHRHYRGQPPEAITWDKLVVTNVKGDPVALDAKLKEVNFADSNKLLVVLKDDGGGGNTLTAVMVDPRVAKAKVARQFELIKEAAAGRKWRVHRLEYPQAFVEVIPGIGVRISAKNYDFVPPSFLLVDPQTERPLPVTEVHIRAGRPVSNLLDSHPVTGHPFFCVQGFWEYHEHPSHYNDPWFIHRTRFSLFSRLDLVDRLLRGKALGDRGAAQ